MRETVDYPFENLGPEKFQEFCQSLLLTEFSGIQCFPVAQPDGGRDAISSTYNVNEKSRKFIMFQVKFARNPFKEEDPHLWLLNILKEEIPKVKMQIPNGASEFVLITNIKGTAHQNSGSIDKVNKLLRSEINIPSVCWWRDDLNRRLDNAWNLKWVYPELMTGPDLIRSIIESGLTENQERRQSAIRAFLTDQYSIDREVKFKQVELQNKLLDLFIDVPISPPQSANSKKLLYSYHSVHNRVVHSIKRRNSISEPLMFHSDFFFENDENSKIGAATFLLHPIVQNSISRIVLEGAPGQGKSTITQYLCQVHRMRILQKKEDLKTISEDHRDVPIRLPVKVDLRDFASWLSKKNPFELDGVDEVPVYWLKSLESFLAALVRHHSGGIEFDVSDFLAIARISSLLLVFDGLDEVADITKRQEVVDEIVKGVNRLEENSASLQVIVTSRPAAFANSPGLPEEVFPYFQLDSVTRSLIDEYAEKWLKARKLQGRESSEVKKILKSKLDLPHLRDLARNPMQLAILLSLIHTRGSSLPDKRTSLYDSYIELFFNRESEKSVIVRDHRELLINIHRYLAWILHTEAETGSNSGSISEEKLHVLLSSYLKSEGHPDSLAKTLFTGMVERVVALVSRVQGTYEFEVQPLREYFTARYLYETAPYSPTGNEKKGTKPDRFDAIARNFYWLNVTRFYAGCYSKGELASLIESLKEIIQEEGYCFISHPRILAATLLSDWVFTQHPKSVQEVIKLVLDGLGLRSVLISNSRRFFASNPLVLPKKCGNDELIAFCFMKLKEDLPKDYALDIIDLINANSNTNEIVEAWFNEASQQNETQRIKWIEYGLYLGALAMITLDQICALIKSCEDISLANEFLIKSKRYDFYEISEDNYKSVIISIFNKDITIEQFRRSQAFLELLINSLDVRRYAIAFSEPQPIPLLSIWQSGRRGNIGSLNKASISKSPLFIETQICYEFIETAENMSKLPGRTWATELYPWDTIVEKIRSIWGNNWACYHLANVASGLNSQSETCREFSDLLDQSKSLCKRTRYARLRAGLSAWWEKQYNAADNEIDKTVIIYLLLTWGSLNVIVYMLEKIDSLISKLPNNDWNRLYKLLDEAIEVTSGQANNRYIDFNVDALPNNLGPRTVTLISLRAKQHSKRKLYSNYLIAYSSCDQIVLEFCQQIAIETIMESDDTIALNNALKVIAQSYQQGVVARNYAFHKVLRRVHRVNFLSVTIAEAIVGDPQSYPSLLVALAESKCKEIVASKIVPVGEIALHNSWFE